MITKKERRASLEAVEVFDRAMSGMSLPDDPPLDGIYRFEIPNLPSNPEEQQQRIDNLMRILAGE